jgi:NAD(P)-dependent dehydrogenase (short-subunit alcohol dehydrogenase family)
MEGAILITGGTSGLGLATASALVARRAGDVVITGRDQNALDRTARAIGARAQTLDLGSLADIAAAVDRLNDAGVFPLRAVVANAGLQVTSPANTEDGFEATFGVNHLGHVALIARLLASGALGPGGRIILVSSGTHDPALRTRMPHPLSIDARELSRPASGEENAVESRRRYTTSKLANVMTSYTLARRLSRVPITVNAFDPGLMPGTGLARDASPVERLLWRTLLRGLVVFKQASTPERSARTLADLAVGEDLAGVSGTYWSVDHERRSSLASYDEAIQDRLWRESLALVGLADPTEPHADAHSG